MGVWSVGPYLAMPQNVVDLPRIPLCNIRFDWDATRVRSRGVLKETREVREGIQLLSQVVGFKFVNRADQQIKSERMLCFGGFNSGARYYAQTPRSLTQGAIKRLFGVRESVEVHAELVENQAAYINTKGPQAFKTFFSKNVAQGIDYPALLKKWIEQPHQKRPLRRRVCARADKFGVLYIDSRTYTDYKGKPMELLAADKQIRSIGEISDLSSFELGPLAPMYKACFAQDFVYRCGRARFIQGPTSEELSIFRNMMLEPEHKIEFCYFSDDSCIAIQCTDGVYRANLDISASDGSMFKAEFEYAKDVLGTDETNRQYVESAFKQCKKDIRLFNRTESRRKHTSQLDFINVKMKKGEYCLPSGFAGTTLMNNFSQILIFSSLVDGWSRRNCTMAEAAARVQRRARMAGFIVKCITCTKFEEIQFLKHSWGMTQSGEYKPYVNLGCMLRGWGLLDCLVDVGKKTLQERMDTFCSQVVTSRLNWGSHVLSDAFEKAYPPAKKVTLTHLIKSEAAKTQVAERNRIEISSLCARYQVSESDLLSFCELIQDHLKFGNFLEHPVVNRIMEQDYGYSSKMPSSVNWRFTKDLKCDSQGSQVLVFPKSG